MKLEHLTLGELTKETRPICYGVLKPGKFVQNGIPLIRVKDISQNYFDDRELYQISNKLDEEFKRSKLKGGELLLSIQGTIGKVAICPNHYEGANISRTIAVIEPDKRVVKNYLRWYLIYLDEMKMHYSSGSTRASLNISYLRKLKIPLPPLDQQKKIAEILDTADVYRQKTKALLEKYDELARSIFMDMFGEDKGYEILELGKVIKLLGGGTPSKKVNEYWNGDIPWVSVKDLKSDRINKTIDSITIEGVKNSATRILPENSLIVATRLANGKAVICEVPMAINQDLKGIEIIGNANMIFLQYLFKSKQNYLESIASGATVKGIKIEDITKIKTPIPPIKVQNDFADKINSIEEQKKILKLNEEKSSELFNSLLQKAFKGELTN